jgi:RNA recognition motif-containing protein
MVNIFIANLDWGITSDDLRTTFSAFGPVTYAHVVYEKETKRSKGFGYVEMEDTDHAINAIEALNGMEVNGRKLDVKIASPKGNRPAPKVSERKQFKKNNFSGEKKFVRTGSPHRNADSSSSYGGDRRPRNRFDSSNNQ